MRVGLECWSSVVQAVQCGAVPWAVADGGLGHSSDRESRWHHTAELVYLEPNWQALNSWGEGRAVKGTQALSVLREACSRTLVQAQLRGSSSHPSLCACSLLLGGWGAPHAPSAGCWWAKNLCLCLLLGKSSSLQTSYLIDNIKPGEVAGEAKCFQLRSWTENSCGTESACWLQQLFSLQGWRDNRWENWPFRSWGLDSNSALVPTGVHRAAHILIPIYKVHKSQRDASLFSFSTWGRAALSPVPLDSNYKGLVVNPGIGNTGVPLDQGKDVTNCIKIHSLKQQKG